MGSIIASANNQISMSDFHIHAEQILEGDPQAKIWIQAQTADKKLTQGVWDTTAGRFTWDYTWDEFIMILEGEGSITADGEEAVTLKAGDFCHFALGTKTMWQVDNYVKKAFTLRTPEPLEL